MGFDNHGFQSAGNLFLEIHKQQPGTRDDQTIPEESRHA